ncbi:MAG TPA: serine--tRNA ligase, partial [Candidatus Obscuribacterales bacterium]
MLDPRIIREHPEEVKKALARRHAGFEGQIDEWLKVDQENRAAVAELERLRQRKNEISNDVKTGKITKEKAQEESKELKEKVPALEELQRQLDEKGNGMLLGIANAPDPTVPDGKDENENVELKKWGTIPKIDKPKEHDEIAKALGILDFERGVKIAETRFTVVMDMGAKLERALMNFMLDMHAGKGYREVFPPIMVNRDCMVGTGQLPKFDGDFYKCEGENLYLVPTAEVPVTNLYRDEILKEEQLPIYHCAYTPNFRREAGSAGKDTRGYIRQHQFNKVELVKFCLPENSNDEHEKLTLNAEAVLEALGLAYRRILLCGGDMGFSAQKCYDLEVWFPGQNRYREISSCSNFGDFQARRANLRYKPADGGKPRYMHTLNGSGLAIG